MDRASHRATGSGLAIARFFGTSSPKSIWTTVENSSARIVPTPTPTACGTEARPRRSPIARPMSGSATYPTTRVVTVIPSCAPESMNDVRLVTPRTRSATGSPFSAAAPMRERSTAMKANSWATK